MTVAWVSQGTVGIGSTTVSAGLPASLATGDGVLEMVVTKPDTATIATPTGWTKILEVAGGGGTTGNGVGPTKMAWFFREKDASWSAMGAVNITGGNASAAIAMRLTKDPTKSWDFASATSTWGTAAATTGAQVVFGAFSHAVGDLLIGAFSNMDEAPTWSSQNFTGSSGGGPINNITERSEAVETTTGNDIGGMYFTGEVGGVLNGNVGIEALLSVAGRGTASLIRVRDVAITDFRSASQLTGATRTTTAVPVPAGAASGDIATVGMFVGVSSAITPPAGFTQKYDSGLAAGIRLVVFWKRLTGADSGTWDFTHASSWTRAVAALFANRATTGDPFTATSDSGISSSATAVAPAITALANDDLVGIATSFNDTSWTPPSGMTEAADTLEGITLAYQNDLTAGSTGTKTFTANSSSGIVGWIGALKDVSNSGATISAAVALASSSTLTVAATTFTPTVVSAAASMSATSSLTVAAPELQRPAAVALSSSSVLTAPAFVIRVADVALSSLSSLSVASPARTQDGAVALVGSSTLLADGARTVSGALSLTSVSTLTVGSPSVLRPATVALTSTSLLTAPAFVERPAAALLAATSNLTTGPPLRSTFGAVGLTAASTLTTAAVRERAAVLELTAASSLTTSAGVDKPSTVALATTSTLTVAAPTVTSDISAAVSLVATSVLTSAATRTVSVSATLTSVSTLAVSATPVRPAATSLTSLSTLTVAASAVRPVAVSLVTSSLMTVGVEGATSASAGFTAQSTLNVAVQRVVPTTSTLTATSTLLVSVVRSVPVAISLAATSSLLAGAAVERATQITLTMQSSLSATGLREVESGVVLTATATLQVAGLVFVPVPGDISNTTLAVMRRVTAYARMRPNFTRAKLRENESAAELRPVWKVNT